MNHPEFPIVTFITAFLLLFPFPFHAKSGNIALCLLDAWLFLANIVYGVDAILFAGSVLPKAIVWCDISVRVSLASTVALPAACLCICVHLEDIASVRNSRITSASKRRRQYAEAAACFLFPCIFLGFYYIVQGHRFDIIEDIGCRPAVYVSIPAILLIWVLPLALSIATLIFACVALSHFIRRRVSFAKHIESRSALTTSKYMRLILMAIVLMTWTVGVTAFTLASNVPGIRPWISWDNVHSNFSRIGMFPLAFLPPAAISIQIFLWWVTPMSAWIFLAFFLTGQEFLSVFQYCMSWFKKRAPMIPQKSGRPVKLPSYDRSRSPLSSSFSGVSMKMLATSNFDSKYPSSDSRHPISGKDIPTATSAVWSDGMLLYTSASTDVEATIITSHHLAERLEPPPFSSIYEKTDNNIV